MTKPLLLLAAVTLVCCIATMPALARQSCDCIRYNSAPVPKRFIRKIELVPPAGHCRRTEIIVTMKNGKVTCTKPGTPWIDDMLKKLQEREVPSKTTVPATASTSLDPTEQN